MAMSASLSLRQSQSLVMTPQLMQSIQLLQMTHFELLQFISQEVEKNPLLEFDANDGSSSTEQLSANDAGSLVDDADSFPLSETLDQRDDWYQDETNSLGDQLDTSFDNVYDDEAPQGGASAELPSQWKDLPESSGEAYDLDEFIAAHISLREHLSQQIPLFITDLPERVVGFQLLDQLDETGYLDPNAVKDIAERLGKTEKAVEAVLVQLQQLEPAGVFSRSLQECLTVQLRNRNALTGAIEIVLQRLDLLAKRDFATLRKLTQASEAELLAMLTLIRSLNPRPGAGFDSEMVETAVPDVFVRQFDNGDWGVELNPATLPKVLVNENYFAKVSANGLRQDTDKAFLTECLQSAHWLTRSLDQRAKTMIKVSSEIVRQQQAFLEKGVDHLKPLNLKTIADAIKMHESTVSRVTSKKYMMTPRGLFELKYFFTASINATEGGDIHSAESVRHRIRQMILQETADSVLSDDDIVNALNNDGIDIARRTVAKYREAMNIGSSVQRRREKKLAR